LLAVFPGDLRSLPQRPSFAPGRIRAARGRPPGDQVGRAISRRPLRGRSARPLAALGHPVRPREAPPPTPRSLSATCSPLDCRAMDDSRRGYLVVVMQVIVGIGALMSVLNRPRVSAYHAVDILALVGAGMCFGVALVGVFRLARRG